VAAVDLWPPAARELVEREAGGRSVRVYPGQAETIPELVERAVGRHPTKLAVAEVDGRSLTYEELWAESEGLAAGLQDRGVEPGDRVAMLFANGVDFCVLALAALRAGAIAVTLSTKYAAPELEKLLEHSRPRVLVAEPEWWPKVEGAAGRLGIEHAETSLERLAGGGDFGTPALSAESPAQLMYTSGTTGLAKGALQSHLNLVTTVETFVRCLELTGDDTTVIAAPLFHATGLNAQLWPMLSIGAASIVLPRYNAGRLVALLEQGAATFIHGAPSMYILALEEVGGQRAPRLRLAVSGGAATPLATLERLREFAPGIDFRMSYGMTETTSPGVLTPPSSVDERWPAVGVPVPVDDVRIDAATGEAGEVLFRGATVIGGYFENDEANAEAFAEGWLHSGDMGTADEDGFVTVVDRVKDMINRGAEKLSSLEVERVLYEHPAVAECAVVGRPDERYGEVPFAVVVLREGTAADERELREFSAERLARFKVPVGVDFANELPRNPGGKVLKHLLRAGT
jgi:long-chain acyl-CoA synthetase